MTCPRCGTANAAGRKFCLECGTPLAIACPACGSANQPGARFCGECGSAITSGAAGAAAPTSHGSPGAAATSAAAATTERRLVSVLFADLVGFTTLAEGRDPETVRDLLGRYFDAAREVIERYGGTVEKFIGDAVMALWGAPVAREDDPERAVRAGLDLLDAVRHLGRTAGIEGLDSRAGVLTGEAAVTIGATNQGMVAGDIVNTAARLQSVALPGTLLVGEATFRAASAAIAFEAVGSQQLKGKEAPVPAWRALRVVAERRGGGRAGGLEAPFVGRDDELRLIKDRFHAVGREHRARLISVVGQAGIGKSRLAWEFLKYIDGLVEDVFWHQGRAPAYGEGVSFWALGEMVRSRAGLTEGDDEPTTRAAVARMVREHAHDEAEARWIESAVLTLLGVGGARAGSVTPAAGTGREELFAAWRTLFERIAEQGTVVLVFEDLQWADPGQVDFIDHLLEWSPAHRILVITLARPELLDRRPTWGAARRDLLALSLDPLPPAVMRELLAGLVPGLPATTADAILGRAGGIPLYAVETVRMLVADGRLLQRDGVYQPIGDLTQLSVPESLHALIAARLDALDPGDRSILQVGSVLGQTFSIAALSAVGGRPAEDLEVRLRSLVRGEMLTLDTDPRSPERGQYGFTQALVREVAYATLSRRDRQTQHLAAARYFASFDEEELSGALATHAIAAWRATDAGPEADALAGQARVALRAAATRALALGSPAQALAWLHQALEVTTLPAERWQLLHEAGRAALEAGDLAGSERLLGDALAIALELGDRRGAATILGTTARTLLAGYRTQDAIALLTPAVEDYADLGDDPGLAEILGQLARAHFFADQWASAVEAAERALLLAERIDRPAVVADVLITKGSVLSAQGRTYEGSGLVEAGRGLAERTGLTGTWLRATLNLSSIIGEGDPARAWQVAQEGVEVARRMGQRTNHHTLTTNAFQFAIRLGRWGELPALFEEIRAVSAPVGYVVPLFESEIELAVLSGAPTDTHLMALEAAVATADDPMREASLVGCRALVAFFEGRLDDAWTLAIHASELDPWNGTTNLLRATRAALASGDPERARTALDGCRSAGTRGPAIAAVLIGLEAGVAALDGDREAALAGHRAAADRLRALDLPVDQMYLGLQALAVLGPDEPLAIELADEAALIAQRLGSHAFERLIDERRAMLAETRQTLGATAVGRLKP